MTEIARQVPDGVIAQLANGQMRQDVAYESHTPLLFLAPSGLNVFFDEEGKNPKAMLKREAPKHPHVKMKTDKKGDPSTKYSAMKHIQQHAPALYHQVLNASVNHGGLHRDTREDSIERLVESDHLIPYDVWKNTINPKMSAIFKKQVQLSNPKEKRPGEDGLAAVTILCLQHRGLFTTKSANFRAQLVQQCDLGRIDVALEMILKDYQRVGALPANKIGVAKVLDLYEKSKIISTAEKVILVAKFLT